MLGQEHRAKAMLTLLCYSTAKSMFPFATPPSGLLPLASSRSSSSSSNGRYSSRLPLDVHRLEGVGKREGIQFRSKPSWKGAFRIRGGMDLGAAHPRAPPHHAPRSGATNYARWRPLARPWQRSSGSVVGRAPHTHQRAASAGFRVSGPRFAEWRNGICFSPLPRRVTRFRLPARATPEACWSRCRG